MTRTFAPALVFGLAVSLFVVGGSYVLTPLLFEETDLLPISAQLVKLALAIVAFTLIRWKTKWLG